MGIEGQAADDAAQFESGYAGKSTPVVEAPTTAEPDKKAEPTPAKAEPEDPIKGIVARLDKFEKSHEKLAGHIGGHQRTLNDITKRLAAAQAATETVTNAPTQEQVKDAITSPQEWEELKREFPSWAVATEKYMDSKLAKLTPAESMKAADIEKMVAERVTGQSAETRKQIIDMALDAVFPGWEDDVATPEFGTWLTSQPEDVQELSKSSRVGDAAKMLRLYEKSKQEAAAAELKPTPEQTAKNSAREKRFAAAVIPKGTGGHASGKSDVDEFEAGYNS